MCGTRKVHQVRGIRPGVIQARRLACFCIGCIEGGPCTNLETVGDWMKEHHLDEQVSQPKQRKPPKRGQPVQKKHSQKNKKRKKDSKKKNAPMKRKVLIKKRRTKDTSMPHKNLKAVAQSCTVWHGSTSHQSAEAPGFSASSITQHQDSQTFSPYYQLTIADLGKVLIDGASLELLPTDMDIRNLYPVHVAGDGNCLARCASLFAYGNEDRYMDIKTLMTEEMRSNQGYYVITYSRYVMYSPHFAPGMRLQNKGDILKVYKREVNAAARDGAYCLRNVPSGCLSHCPPETSQVCVSRLWSSCCQGALQHYTPASDRPVCWTTSGNNVDAHSRQKKLDPSNGPQTILCHYYQ